MAAGCCHGFNQSCPAAHCSLQWTQMTSMHAGLVECEAVGSIPGNNTRPQLHVYDTCIQRYRKGLVLALLLAAPVTVRMLQTAMMRLS